MLGIAVFRGASVIGRYSLNGEAIQFINHTGNEVDSTDLDAGSLVEVQNSNREG
jgi:hypothetical protein